MEFTITKGRFDSTATYLNPQKCNVDKNGVHNYQRHNGLNKGLSRAYKIQQRNTSPEIGLNKGELLEYTRHKLYSKFEVHRKAPRSQQALY